jgi:hypothetical protein
VRCGAGCLVRHGHRIPPGLPRLHGALCGGGAFRTPLSLRPRLAHASRRGGPVHRQSLALGLAHPRRHPAGEWRSVQTQPGAGTLHRGGDPAWHRRRFLRTVRVHQRQPGARNHPRL